MSEVEAQIAASMAAVGSRVEWDVLGTTDPSLVAATLADLCGELGDVVAGRFYEAGVGLVAGLELAGGREVVVKLHRFNASLERLAACVVVQAHLHAAGLPAPEPLLPVRAVGTGFATVEALVSGGRADGWDPAVRRSMAALLHELIAAGRALGTVAGLEGPYVPDDDGDALWPAPHDLRFDFAATAVGAEWIDEHARSAASVLGDHDLPLDVGHFDWRTQNLAFAGAEVVAIYDWDSVTLAPEPWIVGGAAGGFCIDWRDDHSDPPPTLVAMRAFVRDYEAARGRPFAAAERRVLDAANLWMVAYGARCQHSDQLLRPDLGDNVAIGWPRLLRERGGLSALS